MITAPAIQTRYGAFLDYIGEVNYMEYVTKPNFPYAFYCTSFKKYNIFFDNVLTLITLILYQFIR